MRGEAHMRRISKRKYYAIVLRNRWYRLPKDRFEAGNAPRITAPRAARASNEEAGRAARARAAANPEIPRTEKEDTLLLSLIHTSLGDPSAILRTLDEIADYMRREARLRRISRRQYEGIDIHTRWHMFLKPKLEVEAAQRPQMVRPNSSASIPLHPFAPGLPPLVEAP